MPFTAFAAQKKADQVPGRLVVRRIPDFNAEKNKAAGQDTLFDVWRFHAFFTTADPKVLDTVAADKSHRHHAVIEQVHAEGAALPTELSSIVLQIGSESGAARDRTSPCRASTGRAAFNASAPSGCWSAWRDSNPRSTVCKTAALPLRHRPVVDQGGFEPPTSSLSARRPHRTGLLVDRVGQAGLEPAIPCSQSRWDGRFPTTRCVPAPGLEPGCPEGHGVLSAARIPDSARRACLI